MRTLPGGHWSPVPTWCLVVSGTLFRAFPGRKTALGVSDVLDRWCVAAVLPSLCPLQALLLHVGTSGPSCAEQRWLRSVGPASRVLCHMAAPCSSPPLV